MKIHREITAEKRMKWDSICEDTLKFGYLPKHGERTCIIHYKDF